MINPRCLEKWEEQDVKGLKNLIRTMTEELGISRAAQRRKIQALQARGLSRDDALFFLTFYMDEPDDNMHAYMY